MIGYGTCSGITRIVELNDDGETYTIHLHSEGKEVSLKVDAQTLKDLSAAIQIQMFISSKDLTYEPIDS